MSIFTLLLLPLPQTRRNPSLALEPLTEKQSQDPTINHFTLHSIPRVETGKNISTVIPAGRKRRWKGNPVVSHETVMYGYESSATLTTDRLHYRLQIRPLVREGAPS
jgi:hypothetical protein